MKQYTHCKVQESQMLYKWHAYANDTLHIVCICPKCGAYVGTVPQISPYTHFVKGRYVPTPKKEKPTVQQIRAISANPAKDVLLSILTLPGIEKYIGTALYEQAKKIMQGV